MTSKFKEEFEQAIKLEKGGRVDAALQKYMGLLLIKRSPAVLGMIGGLLLHEKDEPLRAIPYLEECVRLSPKSELGSLHLFHAYFQMGLTQDAFNEMRRFLSLSESSEYRRLISEIVDQEDDDD